MQANIKSIPEIAAAITSTQRPRHISAFIAIPWLWLLFGITIGILLYSVLFETKDPRNQTANTLADKGSSSANSQKDQLQREQIQSAGKNYDFYRLLAREEQEASENSDTNNNKIHDQIHDLKKANTLSLKTDNLPTTSYIVQVGSFKKKQDADGMKAKLALSGFSAKIQAVTIRDEVWYRLHLGPFASKELALQAQTKLQHNQISESLLVRQ